MRQIETNKKEILVGKQISRQLSRQANRRTRKQTQTRVNRPRSRLHDYRKMNFIWREKQVVIDRCISRGKQTGRCISRRPDQRMSRLARLSAGQADGQLCRVQWILDTFRIIQIQYLSFGRLLAGRHVLNFKRYRPSWMSQVFMVSLSCHALGPAVL